MTSDRRSLGQRLAWPALVAWGSGTLVVGAFLLAPHAAGLPLPSTGDPRLVGTLSGEAPGTWLVTHVLLAGCECSAQILSVLRTRPPHPEAHELVVLVGRADADDPALRTLGYEVVALSPHELRARYGLEVAPVLVIRDPGGEVRYLGGYTVHRREGAPMDRAIVAALLDGDRLPEVLPVLGCPASDALRAVVDPLGLRPGPRGDALARGSLPDEVP
jgi:hypothetical protein